MPGQTAHAVIGFNSLPFGAVGSVAGFLRVSQALWYVGYFGMDLLWSAFYDDFTLLTRVELEQNSSWACESLFSLLGMRYATEGKKCLPFDGLFRTLGLEVDVSEFREGQAFGGDTRKAERKKIGSQLKGKVLAEGALSPKDAEKLRGRMIFFEGFTFGRVANSSTKSLGRFCGSSNKPKPLDAEMTRALEFLQQRISEGRPLKIERNLHSTWLVFTDGACNQEELKGSVGGVLYDPSGACVGYFGEAVPTAIMDDLFKRSKNPIHEVCGQLVDSSLLLVLVRNVFRAAVVSSVCWTSVLCGITRSFFVLAITTVIFWTGVLLGLVTLEATSTWKSTSCSGFSILTFSSLNRFLAAMLLYNSGFNGFNATS